MSAFDLRRSIESAERRLGKTPAASQRKQRSDRGQTRVSPAVVSCLTRLASGQERPRMSELLANLRRTCSKRGLKAPSRATTYKLLTRLPVPTYRVGDLPGPVQDALYNLEPDSLVPGHQLAFYCFNYGTLEAVSFAAGLPWLAVYQALRLPGYRAKSRGLAEAVARARRI